MSERHVYDAIVLGAGYGGIGVAAQFRINGISDFLVLERAAGIGGVWRDNDYPGAACDTQSVIYCYSFFLNLGVSRLFAGRDELLGYLEAMVDHFELRPNIRLGQEVVAATWIEEDAHWEIRTARGETYLARAFVPAWGQLSLPSIPDFPGLADYRGVSFHSARWEHDVPLAGKRVASIGAAASAVQYVPEIAPVAGRLSVFQRSANYILPRNQVVFTEEQTAEFLRDPDAYRAMRAEIHAFRESGHARLLHDSAAQTESVIEARRHLEAQVADPVLRAKLTPDYEYGCKRVLRSDDYYPALTRPNVELVTDPIDHFDATGIVTADGVKREFNVVIFGTGFKSQAFQGDLVVTGRDGRTLDGRWGAAPEAYLGIVVDGFPNLFLIYGPNTNLNHNSVVTMMEAQQQYVVQAVKLLQRGGVPALDVRPTVLRGFVDEVQRALQESAFTADCNSWYKNADGRVINNWSGTVDEYRALTAELAATDYALG